MVKGRQLEVAYYVGFPYRATIGKQIHSLGGAPDFARTDSCWVTSYVHLSTQSVLTMMM